MGEVVRFDDWAWRRPQRARSRLQRALAVLEPMQRDTVLGLLTVFAPLAERFWDDGGPVWSVANDEALVASLKDLPLAEFPDDGLVALGLEAGYTIGEAWHFKAVLPYFLAGAFARPLENWVLDPDLLKAKLETLGFETWPPAERRAVALALAVYAQHEIDLADGPDALDSTLIAAKRWAEEEFAAAL